VKILIPTADYPPIEGGIASVALYLSRCLAALGHDVTVVAPRFPGMDAFDRAEPVRVIRYSGYGLGWLRLFPLMGAAWAHARRADLILPINIAYGGPLAYSARRPYVAFAYAYEFLKFQRVPPVAAFFRRIYAKARKVIAISAFTRDELIAFGVAPSQIEVVHPGAPDPRPLPPERLAEVRYRFVLDDAPVILAVGRLIPRKGHRTLVRAMPRILERFPNAVLVIAGQGPLTHAVTQEAWRCAVRNQVRLLAGLSDEDVAALYQVCDVFALPTGEEPERARRGQVEGFGLVFAEANAYSKPVVAGRSGGVVDAVLDGETGLLVEPNDTDALANAICTLLGDADLARRLGENGRRRVATELNWTAFTNRLLEIAETTP
jgi:phosphatidyl-myo-inositol dimannoside synthase